MLATRHALRRCRYRAAVDGDERPERGSLLLDEEAAVEDERLWADDGSDDYLGWYCVRTDPFPCPAVGCTFVADYMTAAHLVLGREERDDPNLLWHAQRAKEVGRNPGSSRTSRRSDRARRTTRGKQQAAPSTACAARLETSLQKINLYIFFFFFF